MEAQNQVTGTKSISNFLNNPNVLDKFKNILGEKAQGFISAVLTIVNQSDKLKDADPTSIYTAALLAASLDLPINPNFGFAYIVPYWNSKAKKQEAQFQIGYKGLRQLAIRSGQFKKMIARVVMEDQVLSTDTLEGVTFDFSKNGSNKIAGYVSYFELLNGYSSMFYVKKDQAEAHAKKYSETYKKGFGKWMDDFDKMALKTAVKLHLNSGEAPLSIEMQKAVIADQSVIKNPDTMEVEYVDNQPQTIEMKQLDAERNSLLEFISKADLEGLEILEIEIDKSDEELVLIFENKKKDLLQKQLEDQENGNAKPKK
jgi:recombination protein RecT